MKQVHTTATAGAQSICAQNTQGSPALPGMGTIQEQHFFTPVYRRDLERSIRSLRRDLGFSTSEQAVLIALTSFLPCYDHGQERPIGPGLLLTIFASNEALCDRAGGIDDRTLRRCISRLEKDGWVIRRDSANGKRFARKSKGRPVAAFGIDISPLLQSAADLIKRAQRKAEIEEERRGLVAEAKALIVECERQPNRPALLDFKMLRTSLRRVTMTLHHAKEMVRMLKEHLKGSACEEPKTNQEAKTITTKQAQSISYQIGHGQDASVCHSDAKQIGSTHSLQKQIARASETKSDTVKKRDDQSANKTYTRALCPSGHGQDTADMPASDGQNARHKETLKSESKNTRARNVDDLSHAWDACSELQAFFPDRPRSTHALTQLLFEAGRLLRIGDALIAEAVQKLPLSACITIMDTMMQQVAQISSPKGYFKSVISSGFKG